MNARARPRQARDLRALTLGPTLILTLIFAILVVNLQILGLFWAFLTYHRRYVEPMSAKPTHGVKYDRYLQKPTLNCSPEEGGKSW